MGSNTSTKGASSSEKVSILHSGNNIRKEKESVNSLIRAMIISQIVLGALGLVYFFYDEHEIRADIYNDLRTFNQDLKSELQLLRNSRNMEFDKQTPQNIISDMAPFFDENAMKLIQKTTNTPIEPTIKKDFKSLVKFQVPDWNLQGSAQSFMKWMTTEVSQKDSALPLLANSYRLSLFMESAGINVKGPDYVWAMTRRPYDEDHEKILLKDGEHPCGEEFTKAILPNSYALKGGHCSGCVIVVENGTITNKPYNPEFEGDITIDQATREFCRIFGSNSYVYGENWGREEWWYWTMPRDVFIERIIKDENGSIPMDYKIFIFAGEPLYVYITMCRTCDRPANEIYYIAEGRWELTPYHHSRRDPSSKFMSPSRCWNHVINIVRQISENIPFVRADFYDLDFEDKPCEENIILGEMTFLPMGGRIPQTLGQEMDTIMGQEAVYYFLEKYPCKHGIKSFDAVKFELVLFDLDDLLWKGDVQYTNGGFYEFFHGLEQYGGKKFKISLYPRARAFIRCVKETNPNIKLGIASHGPKPLKSKNALSSFRLLNLFEEDLQILRPGNSKLDHFQEIKMKSGIDFSRIALFDNIAKYCEEATSLGMTAFHLQGGFPDMT